MAVIDSNNFITHLVWSGLIDKATCGELKEAIELCTVKDIYTKADVVDMLDKIKSRIEALHSPISGNDFGYGYISGFVDSSKIVKEQINALKEDRND